MKRRMIIIAFHYMPKFIIYTIDTFNPKKKGMSKKWLSFFSDWNDDHRF